MTILLIPDAQVFPLSPTSVSHANETYLQAASAAESDDASCVFDRNELLARLDGAEDLLERFIGMFLSSAAGHMAELTKALHREDMQEVRFRAHSIGGVAASIGAKQIRFIATQMEERAKAGFMYGVPGFYAELQQALHLFATTTGAATATKEYSGRPAVARMS